MQVITIGFTFTFQCISCLHFHLFSKLHSQLGAAPVAQMAKNLPAMWVTWVQSLGQGDLLEKGMATHSSILAWKIPWSDELTSFYILMLS